MGLMDLASNKSLWRGLDYYEEKKVQELVRLSEYEFSGAVNGRQKEPYQVFINTKNPRKSSCTCPFAKGRRVICKHMIAMYFSVFPKEAEELIRQAKEYEAEEEQRWQKECKEIEEIIDKLSVEQLKNMLFGYMIEEREREYW